MICCGLQTDSIVERSAYLNPSCTKEFDPSKSIVSKAVYRFVSSLIFEPKRRVINET